MKKNIITISALIMMCCLPSEVKAQAFLKKLKDKVEQKMDNAIGNTIGVKTSNTKNTQSGTSDSDDYTDSTESDGQLGYAESLLPAEKKELFFVEIISPSEESGNKAKPLSFAQVLNTRHAHFSGNDLVSNPKAIETAQQQTAVNIGSYMQSLVILGEKQREISEFEMRKRTAAVNQPAMEFSREMAAYIQQKGINPANATEAQMEAVILEFTSKKLGIPAAEMKKIQQMPPTEGMKYMQAHYPNAVAKAKALGINQDVNSDSNPAGKYDALLQELETISNELGISTENVLQNLQNDAQMLSQSTADNFGAAILQHKKNQMSEMENALLQLDNEIRASWATSDVCQKVNDMENALKARLEKWMKDNNKNYNNSFPDWWKENRKEQNKLINEWNAKQASRWVATLKQYEQKTKTYLERIAAIETKLNQQATTKDIEYTLVMSRINSFQLQLQEYLSIPFCILQCPQANCVPEEEGSV